MLYTCARVDRKTVPENLNMYEIRYSDEGGEPCQLGKWIMVDFYGTIISKEPFSLIQSSSIDNAYLDFDYVEDWQPEGWGYDIETYLQTGYQKSA